MVSKLVAMTTALNGSSAGRVAIVTGGSRGVGRAAIRCLAARGYAVVVTYLRDQRAAESIVDAILADNGNAVAVRADVADDLDVKRLFAETIAAFGGIDVVVHAADGPITASDITKVELDEFDALVRINTRATFVVNREAARHLRDGGAIVNLSRSADGSSLRTHGLYAATKAPADVLTRAFALELQERDITVNAVSLDVDIPYAPNQVVEVIAYLLSEHGHGLTGRVIRVRNPGLPVRRIPRPAGTAGQCTAPVAWPDARPGLAGRACCPGRATRCRSRPRPGRRAKGSRPGRSRAGRTSRPPRPRSAPER